MAGLVSKAIRGAAEVGVPMLFAEHKAQIQATRDAKLQEYAQQNTAASQTYKTSERIAGQEFQKDLYGAKTKASLAAQIAKEGRGEKSDIRAEGRASKTEIEEEKRKHSRAKEIIDYEAESEKKTGGKKTANQKDVKAMVVAGVFATEKEAWEALKNTSKMSDIIRFYNTLYDSQKANYIRVGAEGYRTPKELFEEAKQIVSGRSANVSPKSSEPKKITTFKEYDALPSGTIYIHPSDGKQYKKP